MMTIVAICLLVKEVPPQPQLLIKQLLSLLATEISPPRPWTNFLGDQTQFFRFHQFKLRLDCIEHTLNLGVVLKPYISLMMLCLLIICITNLQYFLSLLDNIQAPPPLHK